VLLQCTSCCKIIIEWIYQKNINGSRRRVTQGRWWGDLRRERDLTGHRRDWASDRKTWERLRVWRWIY
jgi:hypothetical protein